MSTTAGLYPAGGATRLDPTVASRRMKQEICSKMPYDRNSSQTGLRSGVHNYIHFFPRSPSLRYCSEKKRVFIEAPSISFDSSSEKPSTNVVDEDSPGVTTGHFPPSERNGGVRPPIQRKPRRRPGESRLVLKEVKKEIGCMGFDQTGRILKD